jgi:hypothetical protein
MGAAVTHPAIGRRDVSVLEGLAVHPAGVFAGLVWMAGGADGFGNARGMGILFVLLVTGVTSQACVRAPGQFLRLVVAGGASRRCLLGVQIGARRPEQNTHEGSTAGNQKEYPACHGVKAPFARLG